MRAAAVFAAASPAAMTTADPAAAEVRWVMASKYLANSVSDIGLTSFARAVAARTDGALTVATALDDELKITAAAMPGAAVEGRLTGGDAFA